MPEKEVDRREEVLKQERKDLQRSDHKSILSAMDEYMKERCLEFIQWMLDKGVFATRVVDGQTLLYYRGEYITKEQLFENFL